MSYVQIQAGKVAKMCEESIRHIENTRKHRDQEFKDWAIPYFNKKCRQKWWQFWRRPKFKNLKDFNKWWDRINFMGLDLGRLPMMVKGEDIEAFAKVSKDFRGDIDLWYPSSYGLCRKSTCFKLLNQINKLRDDKDITLSLEDFGDISFDSNRSEVS